MKIDHLTIAGPDLDLLQRSFADVGMRTIYGGAHSNGITHMSLLSFSDGSYLELVAPLNGGCVPIWSDWWMKPSGGTAWTILSSDVAVELQRAKDLGIGGKGPIRVVRKRPDSEKGEWDLGYLGNGQPGGLLPFLIRDCSPREVRVPPVSNLYPALLGWSRIVIAVEDLPLAIDQFRRLHDLPAPQQTTEGWWFSGTPIILQAPAHNTKLDSPCVVSAIIECAQTTDPVDMFCFSEIQSFLDGKVGWFKLENLPIKIGVRLTS